MTAKATCYARAGVDIDRKMKGLAEVKRMVDATATPAVLAGMGPFGGLFAAPGRDHVLVASTDGVGTKLKVAAAVGDHRTVGEDLVNHCVNDILTLGAEPLFFLDYVGMSRFDARVFRQILQGLCRACRQNGCALLGGETAELPGLYPAGEYDLVGTIVGAVKRSNLVTGREIRPGDVVLGLPSSGLHTNGYTLARKIVFDIAGLKPHDLLPGTGRTVASALLAVHRSYLAPVRIVRRHVRLRGMAHITGGGFFDNIPRVLPASTRVVIETGAWTVPPLFRFLQERGGVSSEEMYRVFNMGIGYVIFVRASDAQLALKTWRQAGVRGLVIGRVERGRREVVLR